MIKIIDGDLLTSGADIICHQVNCQGKMGSGVAKQIKEKWSDVFIVYRKFVNDVNQLSDSKELLGTCQCVPRDFNEYPINYVANLFGQYSYGYDSEQYTDMDALKKSLLELRDFIPVVAEQKGIDKSEVRIAIPWKIGCVRGGANWTDVYSMIHFIFEDYNVELWRLDKG